VFRVEKWNALWAYDLLSGGIEGEVILTKKASHD
jgi:hypothetical protein